MKKTLIFVLAFLGVIALYIWANFYEKQGKRELIPTEKLEALGCDLNQKACEYEFKGQKVVLEFRDKPLQVMQENKLFVKNLGEFKALNARLYGLNMYMGDLVPSFEKIGEKEYKTALVLSFCPLEKMRYRLEFFENDTALDFYVDFDVLR